MTRILLPALFLFFLVALSGCSNVPPNTGTEEGPSGEDGSAEGPDAGSARVWFGNQPESAFDRYGCAVDDGPVVVEVADDPVRLELKWSIVDVPNVTEKWVFGHEFIWSSWPGQGPAGQGVESPEGQSYRELVVDDDPLVDDTTNGTHPSREWEPDDFALPGTYKGAFLFQVQYNSEKHKCDKSGYSDVSFQKSASGLAGWVGVVP